MIPYLNEIKIALVIGAIVGAFFWHNSVATSAINEAVNSAVQVRTQEINDAYAQRLNDLKTDQDKNQKVLDNKTKETLEEKQNALQASTNKYNNLLEWVRAQPSSTTNDSSSTGDLIRDTRDSESTGSVLNNGLLRKDAIDLAEYAQRTQELKVYLNSCYRQYDDAKVSIDSFVLKHNSK